MKNYILLFTIQCILANPLTNCVKDSQDRTYRFQFTYPETIQTEHFKIHYTTATADSQFINGNWLNLQCNNSYAESVINLAEYSLDIFMNKGWEMMPPDCDESITDESSPNHCNNFGGNALYDIYLTNDAAGLVVPEQPYPVAPFSGGYSSYMIVSTLLNEHETIPSWSKHVVAHELHHAIQVRYGIGVSGQPGNYAYNGWLLEQTATYMENVVFPESIHLSTMLGNCNVVSPLTYPEYNIDSSVQLYQYRSALWQKFLVEAYGDSSIIRLIWEGFGNASETGNPVDVFPIYNDAIQFSSTENIDLTNAYIDYSTWRYFTGDRTNIASFFEEANSYCTAYSTSLEESPFSLSTQHGGALFVELPFQQSSIRFSSNDYDKLIVNHIVKDSLGIVSYTTLEIDQSDQLLGLNNPNNLNQVLIITSQFTNEPTDEIEFSILDAPIIQGDINQDGLVNVVDIVAAVNLILTDSYDSIVDMNEDGELNVVDIVLLINIILS
jgi:hypothetical protein